MPRQPPTHAAVTAHRRRQLLEAATGGRLTRIGGVLFVINSKDFDPDIWRPDQPVGHEPAVDGAPRLAFPWTSADERHRLEAGGGFVEAKPGDAVVIRRVERHAVPTHFREFDHPHETEELLVTLKLLRRNRSVVPIQGALKYTRSAFALRAALDSRTDEKVLNELIGRLGIALGVEDLPGCIESAFANPSRELPVDRATLPNHLDALMALYRAFGGAPEAFATFGYQMGRAEAHEQILPRAIGSRDAVLLGAKVNIQKRRANAAEWQSIAMQLAEIVLVRAPTLRGIRLARAVNAIWLAERPRGSATPPVSDRHLAAFFLERLGRGG